SIDGTRPVIRVVVAGGHQPTRERLRAAVDAERDMVCVGVATDGREALEVTIEESPDVLVVSAEMRHLGGVAVALQLRRMAPGVKTVLYDSKQVSPVIAPIAEIAECVVARPSLAEIVPA